MGDMFKAGSDVTNTMRDLVKKYHPHLATITEEIAILFKDKASQVGDLVVAGKASKAPALLPILSETNWKFVIILATDVWQGLSDKQKLALLDHYLCACRADEDEKTHEVSYYIQPPDVSFYRDEVTRHGFWRTTGAQMKEDLIAELFGEKK